MRRDRALLRSCSFGGARAAAALLLVLNPSCLGVVRMTAVAQNQPKGGRGGAPTPSTSPKPSPSRTAPKPEPAAPSLPGLANAAMERQEWSLAIQYLSKAQKENPREPAVLHKLGIAHANAGNPLAAILWLKAYLASTSAIDAAKVQREIDAQRIAAIAAVRRFVETSANSPGTVTYQSFVVIAMNQARYGDLDGATQTASLTIKVEGPESAALAFQDTAEQKLEADDKPGALAAATEAARLFEQIGDDKEKIKGLTKLSDTAIGAGYPYVAQEWLKTSYDIALKIDDKDEEKDSILSGIAAGRLAAGDEGGAIEIYKALLEYEQKTNRDDFYRKSTLQAIFRARMQAGDFDEAQLVLASISAPGDKVEALTSLPEKIAPGKIENQWRKNLQQAHQIALGIKDGYAAQNVVYAYLKLKDFVRARQVASDTKDSGLMTDIARDQIRAGKRGAAAETLKEAVQLAREQPHYFGQIVPLQLYLGDAAGARPNLLALREESLKQKYQDSRLLYELSLIASLQAEAADIAETRNTLKYIEDLLPKMSKKYENRRDSNYISALHNIAAARAGSGDYEGAFQLLTDKELSHNKEDILARIARAQAQAGDLKAARQTAQRSGFDNEKIAALKAIAEVQLASGDARGALQTISQMEIVDWLDVLDSPASKISELRANVRRDWISDFKGYQDRKLSEAPRNEARQPLADLAYNVGSVLSRIHWIENNWTSLKASFNASRRGMKPPI